jgi:hypothetical protein
LDVDALGFLTTPLDDSRVKIRSVSFQGGRNRELDAIPPSTATIVFDNRDGLFNPSDTSSPYFGIIFPGKAISLDYVNKVAGVSLDASVNVFSGVVTDWSFDFDINGDATATVSAKDLLGLLAGVNIPATAVPQESTEARFKRICLLAGLNDAQVATGGSYSVMASGTIEGDALQLAQEVVFHEQGYTLVLGGGISFVARNVIPNGYNAFFTNTGSGEGGIPNYPFTDLQVAYSSDTVANSVTTTSTLGTAVFTDSAKVAQFGLTSKSYDVSYSTIAQQKDLAGFLVNTYGAPEFRPNSLTVSIDGLLSLPYFTTNQIDGNYALQFVGSTYSYGLPVRVLFAPPGGSVDWIDETLVISSWSHSSTPSGYNVTIGLEPNPFQNVFVLDNLFFGVLDEDKLGF